MSAVRFPESIQADDPIGGKARSLADLRGCDVAVPPWFVVLPSSDPLADPDLNDALRRLGADRFAVRSSSLEEDGAERSLAGQLESFLYVKCDAVSAKIAAVRTSATSAQLKAYRVANGRAAEVCLDS